MSGEQDIQHGNRTPAPRAIDSLVEAMWGAVERLPAVPKGRTRLWRATGDGEEAAGVIGSAFGDILKGGIMVWYQSRRRRLVYVDVPTWRLNQEEPGHYLFLTAGPGGKAFELPTEVTQSAQPVVPYNFRIDNSQKVE